MGATKVTKTEFFGFFQTFHDRCFKNPRLEKSAFRKTGLIPLNPMVVLSKMKDYFQVQKATRPLTPPPRESSPMFPGSNGFTTPPPQTPLNWNLFETPLTLRSRKIGVDYVRERQMASISDGIPLIPSVTRVTDKIEAGSMRSILAGALSTYRVHGLGIVQKARNEKDMKEDKGKIVQKYGEIYGHQALTDIAADIEDEKVVVNMRLQRKQKEWSKKWDKVAKQVPRNVSLS